ncbi:Dipeptidyl aminopeptidase/acylaminoacyl peptidase [Solilutibacter tolerans]|uniref:Dipeptidyl aminopeptidase/acylaminoacyl peptidase n=2 Tax=Solilutibacter tolerans TaxID=1604334 RepID=A0A1N6PBH7_9GAMM|nr:Dipeptidyl aminopeptidase/acylaminoacyl peptidase [Lysobacter tolerans]
MFKASMCLTAIVVGLCLPAFAQIPTAHDFARHSEVYEVALSPDGKHVAMTLPTQDNRETQLLIAPLDGNGKTQRMRFGNQEHVSDIVWTADDRVTLARARNMPLQPMPYSLGQLFSTDVTGKDQETLFGYFQNKGLATARRKDEGFASLAKVLDEEPGSALVWFTCWNCGERPDTVVYKVDTRTGNRQEVERVKDSAHLYFDQTGHARVMVGRDDNDEPTVSYRRTPTADWAPMPESLVGYNLSGIHFDASGNKATASVSDKGEAPSWYRLDLNAGTRTPIDYRAGFEAAYVPRAGRNGPPIAVISLAAKPSVQYLDPTSEFTKLHAGLMKAFPAHIVDFDDFSRDSRKVLFRVFSDRQPTKWYVIDRDTMKTQLVAESMPWIKAEQMASVTPIEFKSRHGETMHGFITSKGPGPRPMVVMPHGGPHGPYDSWGFDPHAQFLASRGYAVLQVNFRGSGGRGINFEKSGYREWGGKMQDDIADAVRWSIDNKVADPSRICTFGASYGGYAALMQPLRFPELYKCAIGYVGVYDLTVMKKEGDITQSRDGRRYLDRVLGKDDAQLKAWSPAQNVDAIKVPVFLVQGDADRRVPMPQFNALKNAFTARDIPVETMVAAGEGHGFYSVKNREALYQRMEEFLGKHIGAGAK